MDRENNYKLVVISLTTDATVTHAPTTVVSTLQPPKGFVWEVISVYSQIPDPVGSAAGTHVLEIYPLNRENALDEFSTITSNTGSNISIRNSIGIQADTETPSNIAQQYEMLHNIMVASYDEPLAFSYTNSTDVDQSGTRYLVITVKEYREAI